MTNQYDGVVDYKLSALNRYGKAVVLLAITSHGLFVLGGSAYVPYSVALLVPIVLTITVALYRNTPETDAERNPHDEQADSSGRGRKHGHEPDGSKGKPLAEY